MILDRPHPLEVAIETIWSILKRRISETFDIAKDVAELRDFAQRAWATITLAEVNATIKERYEKEIEKHAEEQWLEKPFRGCCR
jgi:hypothetical protein